MVNIMSEVYKLSVNLCSGLVILIIIINLTLDSLDDVFNTSFEWRKLLKGSIRGIVILACFIATYFVGYINKDLVIVTIIENQDLNLMDAVALMTITAYFFYAKQVISKLFSIITSYEKEKGKND